MDIKTPDPQLKQEPEGIALEPQVNRQNDEVYLLDYLVVLARNTRLLFRVTMICAIVTAAVSLLFTNYYTSQTRLLPPQQRASSLSMMLADITQNLGGGLGLSPQGLGFGNPSDIYVDMLQSRTVADRLIARFSLLKWYKVRSMTDAREILDENSEIKANENGVIVIRVTDKDPALAAALANGYTDELMNLTRTLAVTDAAQQRLYYERELESTKKELTAAEEEMTQTQRKTGIIHLESQGMALIESAALVRAQIVAKQVELRSMSTYATSQNPEAIRVKQELAALESALAKMQGTQAGGQGSLELRAGTLPTAALEYQRSLRNLKFYQVLYELLAKQYEAAKLDEGRNSAVIQVLDRAVPPEKKSGPNRLMMVLVAALLGAAGGMTFVFVRENNARAQTDPEYVAKMELLKMHLRPRRSLWRWTRKQ